MKQNKFITYIGLDYTMQMEERDKILKALDAMLCQLEWDISNSNGDGDNYGDQLKVYKKGKRAWKILAGKKWKVINLGS